MRRRWAAALGIACVAALVAPARLASGDGPQFDRVLKRVQQLRELQVTDEEERQIGEAVSQRIRVRYGVVQDRAVHRYVSLVGAVVAAAGSRPGLDYRFIVLDTDGVNAFAAPGGFIHVTRGALALVSNEAELAGILAHELVHVTEKHTVRAIQKSKAVQMGANETLATNRALFDKVVDNATEVALAGFGRAEELESDQKGVRVMNKVGYAPSALAAFLERLTVRNKGSEGKQGLFASHPEMQERLSRMRKQIDAERLTANATLADRYHASISYRPKGLTEIAAVEGGSAGLAGAAGKPAKPAEKTSDNPPPKKKGFGLGSLLKPAEPERKSAEVTGSAASRGVDTERNAKGGAVATPVAVHLTPADIAAFRKEGNLR
jgi:predicted Zn-dependent protease